MRSRPILQSIARSTAVPRTDALRSPRATFSELPVPPSRRGAAAGENGRLFPVEIQCAAPPSTERLAGFRALAAGGAPVGAGAVVALVALPAWLGATVRSVPVGALR
jgi:hypothetical protein